MLFGSEFSFLWGGIDLSSKKTQHFKSVTLPGKMKPTV